jgi:hypothetical protein
MDDMRMAYRSVGTPHLAAAIWAVTAGLSLALATDPALAGIVTSAGGNYDIARSMMPRGDSGQAPAHRRHTSQSHHHHHSGKAHGHGSPK